MLAPFGNPIMLFPPQEAGFTWNENHAICASELEKIEAAMKTFCRCAVLFCLFLALAPYEAQGKLLTAYISDSPSS